MHSNITKINVLLAARARNPHDLSRSHITACVVQCQASCAPSAISENEVRTDGAFSQEIVLCTERWIEHASSSRDTLDPVSDLGVADLNLGQEDRTIIHSGFLGPPPSFQVKVGTVHPTRSRLFSFHVNKKKHLLFDAKCSELLTAFLYKQRNKNQIQVIIPF
jgi:hypothetical protein